MELQQDISLKKNQGLIGSKQTVLIDGKSQDSSYLLEGRTYAHAPEVDGVVFITDRGSSSPSQGEMVTVEITDALPYDLVGKVI